MTHQTTLQFTGFQPARNEHTPTKKALSQSDTDKKRIAVSGKNVTRKKFNVHIGPVFTTSLLGPQLANGTAYSLRTDFITF